MALLRRTMQTRLAATSMGVAAICIASVGVALAETPVARADRTLAAELRVLQGDLARLRENGLPEAHREGLEARVTGSLGLVPWLLIQSGDEAGADRLAADRRDDPDDLAGALDSLIGRHPFDLLEQGTADVSAKALLDARAIHETYCAGCHDDTGEGDPGMKLPIRDLFGMAREEPADIFAARLYVGVKGDATIGFQNPLTETQFLALWRYYSTD
ncbi:hypothetical protein [Maritimibacter sp. HL-12]|jgi:cytochrome c553|uniref:c-type cytochrome n=1 Tax=Maritimibacter sp. HL-12 TaxID=1162418 RepID=UPI000A0F2A75|nr:hypothetical protein [Maritimibacter sp. HL-12]SMH45601.1 hypothetical protein SAMN05661107_1621 [Maritimibacter sp. HL-12]